LSQNRLARTLKAERVAAMMVFARKNVTKTTVATREESGVRALRGDHKAFDYQIVRLRLCTATQRFK
jgi:hypothetical protein